MDYTSFAPGTSAKQNTPVPSPFVPEPHRHFLNKKFAITFGVLILLATGAYAGIWYWQKQQVAVVAPTPTPKTGETVNWKTYTSTEYGFEFKYPSDWVPSPSLTDDGVVDFQSPSTVSSMESMPGPYYDVRLIPLSATVEEKINSINSMGNVPVKAKDLFVGVKKSVVGGLEVTSYQAVQNLCGDYVFEIAHNKSAVVFETCRQEQLSVIEKIISTFKFTDSIETSNWKTYKNTRYGFEFKYPANWVGSQGDASFVLVDTSVVAGDPPTMLIDTSGKEQPRENFTNCVVSRFASFAVDQCLTGPDWLYPGKTAILSRDSKMPLAIFDFIDNDVSHQILSTFRVIKPWTQ
ncbi:MAG: hypothetical protein KBC81_00340 [Candidatus Pacebacteria bacterium]|nr:hypothetical protein [Candidatus Paceibacterota bacterium]